MLQHALLSLPPTAIDLAVSRAIARHATKPVERSLAVLTWLADEKIVAAGALALWGYCRLVSRSRNARRCGDRVVAGTAVAVALPHLTKRVVDRKRPDREVVHGRRHGIPRSGNAWDSFPSGHAVHLGVLASALRRFVPRPWRGAVWPVALALASTRILLLAHYPSDVAAGLALGVGIDRLVGRTLPAARGWNRPSHTTVFVVSRQSRRRLAQSRSAAERG